MELKLKRHLIYRACTRLLALMLMAFTMRHMVRSAHLALSPMRFTDQLHFTFSDRYLYEKIHTASSGTARCTDLSTRLWLGLDVVVTCAEMSPSRLPNDAVCI